MGKKKIEEIRISFPKRTEFFRYLIFVDYVLVDLITRINYLNSDIFLKSK